METITLTREALYEQVWCQPVHTLARQYRISGVALAKICRKLKVPVPPRGYWARLAVGQSVKRPALPALTTGQPMAHRLVRRIDVLIEAGSDDEAREAQKDADEPEHTLVVPDRLTKPHPLVRTASRLLRTAAERDRVRYETPCLDIAVSKAARARALRVIDTLLKGLEERGLTIEVTKPKPASLPQYGYQREELMPSETGVHIGDAFVTFGIDEAVDIVKVPPRPSPMRRTDVIASLGIAGPPVTYERRPTGRLVLRIRNGRDGARRSWSDGKQQRVEGCLDDFVRALLATAERMRLRRLEAERRERERLEEERRREEEARRRRHEARLVYDLKSRTEDWTTAKATREFLAAVEADATERLGRIDPASELGEWLAWTRQRADHLEASALRTVLQLRTPPDERPAPAWLRFS